MPALDYAPPPAWHRRRRWHFVLIITTLALASLLATPKWRAFREQLARRAQIRAQFAADVAAANKALDANRIDAAAAALLHAEFPFRTEPHLFGRSEHAQFENQLVPARQRLIRDDALRRQQEAAARMIAEETRKQAEADPYAIHQPNRIRVCYEVNYREATLVALKERAAEQLRARRMKQVLGICEQIVAMEPTHQFDAVFWSNALPR